MAPLAPPPPPQHRQVASEAPQNRRCGPGQPTRVSGFPELLLIHIRRLCLGSYPEFIALS